MSDVMLIYGICSSSHEETPRCSGQEVSEAEVLAWRVARPQSREPEDRDEGEDGDFK